MKKNLLKKCLSVLFVTTIGVILSSPVYAVDFEAGGVRYGFHGYFESNFVLRDTNGFQYGFMDQVEGVQQRNTLKMDVDVYPSTMTFGPFSLSQLHFTFRGAYDTIFNFRDYDITKDSGNRFEYDVDDIKYEMDFREAFMDVSYNGSAGSAFLRLGRQIVSWGETTGIVLLDVINPFDNSFQMFFQNPDDLMTPLWMARLNYLLPPGRYFNLEFDLLVIPDIRPTQFAPLDDNMEAPYAFIFAGLAGLDIEEDVPTHETEYGIRITAGIGDRLRTSFVYFRDVVNDPAVELTNLVTLPVIGTIPTKAIFAHRKQHVYGGTFTYDLPALELIIRGELSRYTDYPVNLPGTSPDIALGSSGVVLKTYRLKPITQWMLALDKDIYVNWITDKERTKFSAQWIRKKINSWDSILDGGSLEKTSDLLSIQIMWNWWNGRLSPLLFAFYDTEGTWMAQPSIKYLMSENLYFSFAAQTFWGNTGVKSSFSDLIQVSELTFKLGYQW